MSIKTLLVILFLPICARAVGPYSTHPLSEAEMLATYTTMLREACLHADQFWTNWSADPRGGYWGSGRSDNMNEGIRANAGMVLACAALLKYSDAFDQAERAKYRGKVVASIHYAAASHVTGPLTCTDGKHWGDSWQSAMWTADMSFGAWLIWDELDAETRKDVERFVSHEADRFLDTKPPAGSFNDTKAEENGWDLTCLAVAANMFREHPHANAWREKAIEYMMNTLSAPQDATDAHIVDGKPVKDWFTGANVHEDFTLENHGFFHPGYIGCSSYFLTQTAMYFTYAHQPVPQAATHHLMDTWKMFQEILLPNGESACPQSMDWELHGLPYNNLFASLARWQHDPLAARLEKTYLPYVREWQVMRHGDLAVPGSKLGFTRHAVCAELNAYSFLAHKIFGEPAQELSAREAALQVEGVRLHPWIQLATHRTENKFVSFSWINRIMGMVIPIGPGHEGNPDFTAPIIGGFVGGFDLIPKENSKPSATDHGWSETSKGFETHGTLLLNGGRLKQILSVTSIGEKTVVYQDRVTALADVTIAQEHGFPLGIENDEVTGGTRTLSFEKGREIFDWQKPRPGVAVRGSWANVDGRVGIIMASGAGISYHQAKGYQQGMAVCADMLYGSFSDQHKKFKAGEEVAHRIVVVFLETSPEETAALAKFVRVETGQTGTRVHFKTPEGNEMEIRSL